jgi:hypothetical protein
MYNIIVIAKRHETEQIPPVVGIGNCRFQHQSHLMLFGAIMPHNHCRDIFYSHHPECLNTPCLNDLN